MEENKKKTTLSRVISCVIVGLLVFSLLQIVNLNSEIDNLKSVNSRLNSEINLIRNDIKSIYNNVDEKLKEQASLLSGVDYSIGKPNKDMKTVPLSITVVPKTVTNEIKLSVTVDGAASSLTRNGNEFSGTVDVGLFVDYDEYPLLTIESSEGIQTEYLDDVDIANQFSNYLPSLEANMSSSSQVGSSGLHVDSNFELSVIYADKDPSANFTSITLVEKLNGEEIGREDITDKVIEAGDRYSSKYVKNFEIANANEYDLRVYVIAEDSLGYTHEVLAGCWMDNRMDAMIENTLDNEIIYDKDGNMLWQKYISWN